MERKAREELFEEDADEDADEDAEDVDGEEGDSGRYMKGSSKRSSHKRGRGGAESDSDDEDKDAGVWADNEAEAMLGPGDQAKVNHEVLIYAFSICASIA